MHIAKLLSDYVQNIIVKKCLTELFQCPQLKQNVYALFTQNLAANRQFILTSLSLAHNVKAIRLKNHPNLG